jgi:hypothetical protein
MTNNSCHLAIGSGGRGAWAGTGESLLQIEVRYRGAVGTLWDTWMLHSATILERCGRCKTTTTPSRVSVNREDTKSCSIMNLKLTSRLTSSLIPGFGKGENENEGRTEVVNGTDDGGISVGIQLDLEYVAFLFPFNC